MKDINDIIERVTASTGLKEQHVEKVIRSVFADVQDFANKKQGVCIQIPHVGTFRFRINAIPNYIDSQKSNLTYWIRRLFIGQHKQLVKTVTISTANIQKYLFSMRRAAMIKDEYLKKHSKYKPSLKKYLESDPNSDTHVLDSYINILCSEIFIQETNPFPEDDL